MDAQAPNRCAFGPPASVVKPWDLDLGSLHGQALVPHGTNFVRAGSPVSSKQGADPRFQA